MRVNILLASGSPIRHRLRVPVKRPADPVAQIHGLEDGHGQTALVMELVVGPTLAHRIAQGPIPLDEALEALAQFAERQSRVIELRFFGGLSVEETASVLKVSPDTVMRDWRLAKAWLQREMRGHRPGDA